MKTIELTRGYSAVVDDEDSHLAEFNWHVSASRGGLFYAARRLGSHKHILMHRELLGLVPGDLRVDHINGDTLDNRRSNLRTTSASENSRNIGLRKDSRTGVSGVGIHSQTGRYIARIRADGREIYLGCFEHLEDAREARLKAEKIHWGIQPRRAALHMDQSALRSSIPSGSYP